MAYQRPESTSSAPSPPAEIRLRTLESDTVSVSRGGGSGAPDLGTVTIAFPKRMPVIPSEDETETSSRIASFLSPRMIIGGGAVLFALIVGSFGYYAYSFIRTANPDSPSPVSGPPSPPVLPQPLPTPPPPLPPQAVSVIHESLFRIPADRSFDLTFSRGPAVSVFDLQTYGQRVTAALADAGIGFFEILPHDENGAALSASDFFAIINVSLLPPSFLGEHFTPDLTAFVESEPRGLFPGYVLRAKNGASLVGLQADVRRLIETSADVRSVFLVFPEGPASAFRGKTVGGRSVRYLGFASPSGAEFSYAWFSDKLVIATSEAVLTTALEHIGR